MLNHFKKYRIDYLFVLLIIIVTLVTVLFKIGEVPPAAYPWSDESDVASDAVLSFRHGLEFHYPAQLAGGPIAVWLETGWIHLFGPGLTGLRFLNGLVNLTSILFLYLVVRQLPFGRERERQFHSPTFNQWLGLSAALFMAVSTWILGLARIATPNWSLVSPMTTLTFYFLWRALNTDRRRYFIATGIMMGALFYGYIPGYCVPLVPAIFLGSVWFSKQRQSQLRFPISRWYWYSFPVALVVATPIFVFFALHPDAVLQRVVQLAHTNELSLVSLFTYNLVDTLAAFGFWPVWLLQGRFDDVAFDPLVTVLFIAGLLITLRRWRDNVYFFLIVWWVVMIAPAFLSRSASTGFIFEIWRRGIGAQPVSFVFVGLTVVTAAQWLTKRFELKRQLARLILPVLLTVTLLVAALSSFWLYFGWWANSGVIPMFFPAGPVQLVDWMEETTEGQDTRFIFPVRPNVSPTVRPELFSVRYLYDGEGSNAFPLMDEETVGDELTQLFDQKPALVHLMLHDRIVVDPKDYFQYALATQGRIIDTESQPDYDVITYRMRPNATFERALEPAAVAFGDQLRLTGRQIQPHSVPAGHILGAALRWQKQQPGNTNYNASIALYDAQGFEWARLDKPLLSAENYLTTRHWSPGDESVLYYALPVPADMPPGEYTLRLRAYTPKTGEVLPPETGSAGQSFALAQVEVQPPPTPVDAAAVLIEQPLDVQVTEGLQLVGSDPVESAHRPGERMWLSLWWQGTESLSGNVGLVLALANPGSDPIPLFETPRPLLAGLPLSAWTPGQVYRANYPVRLPATVATGEYRLVLRLFDLDTQEPLGEQVLFPVPVEARSHRFEAAPLAHQINVDFEDVARLLSVDLEIAPSEITLQTQWQALRPMDKSYKMFVHLTGANRQIISQFDTVPQQGTAPTTGWVPDEIIQDELILPLPADLPPGPYRLVIGLYNPETGQRLQAGGQDTVRLFEGEAVQ